MINFIKNNLFFHLALISIWLSPYFIFYEQNFGQITFLDTLQPLFFLIFLFSLVFLSLFLSVKIFPNQKLFLFGSAIIMSIAVMNFDFIYFELIRNNIETFLESYMFKDIFFQTLFFLFLLIAIIFFNFSLKFYFFKNFVLFCCIFGLLVPCAQLFFKIANDKSNIYFSSESKLYETKTEIPPLNRNVYFVVLDGYASKETFKKMNKNNDNFYEYLKNNEFKFLGSKAAFNTTYLSLASIFYLDYAVQEGDNRYTNRKNFFPLLLRAKNQAPLIKELSKLKYTLTFYGNTWSGCYSNHVECGFLPQGFLANESFVLFSETALKFFLNLFRSYQYDAIGNFISTNYEIEERSSSFTFIHQLSPHDPYLREDCITLTKNLSPNDYMRSVKCVNLKVRELIDTLNQKDPSAIIVIQSDHGPDTNEDWFPSNEGLTENIVKSKVGIINVIKPPEKCKQWLLNDLGPINTTRFILGCLSQQEPAYLDEKTLIGFYENHVDFGLIKRHIHQ